MLKRILEDAELSVLWERLSESAKEVFREIDAGKRVPDLLNDTMFKCVFDPNVSPEWLSRLISSVIGKNVKIRQPIEKEGRKRSIYSKGVIMDIVVEFEDGEIADVEIQRKGLRLPPQRSAIYCSEILTRSYSVMDGEEKKSVDYDMVRPIHMIIIMEDSPSFLKNHVSCQHHFRQTSDTGILSGSEFELLQYYHYICLDVFYERRPHVAQMLEKWLTFLSIKRVDEMMRFLTDNPEFEVIYKRAVEMLADREVLMRNLEGLFDHEDIAGSINLTNESIIKRMKKESQEKDRKIREQDREIRRIKHDAGMELQRRVQQLSEKDREIEELKRQLERENRSRV